MPGFEVIDNLEKAAVAEVFDEGGVLFAHGFDSIRTRYHVREFELECKKYFGAKYNFALSSGTASLKCALKAVGVKPGDEVITQGFNFIATFEAIIDCGATPVVVGIDQDLHLSMESLDLLVTPKTKCIIIVHMLGIPGPTRQLKEYCDNKKIALIEDACEAVGAKSGHDFVGTLGDIGVFSFDHGKNLTCGEGGMCLTSNHYFASYISSYSDHGHQNKEGIPRGNDLAVMPGFNYRMTELQAAVGKVQLSKLSNILNMHKERYCVLASALSPKFRIRNTFDSLDTPSYDTFVITNLSHPQILSLLGVLKSLGLGTKNLPDAMRWHCSAYWNHMLDAEQIIASAHTLKSLEKALAIPILCAKPVELYVKLAEMIIQEV